MITILKSFKSFAMFMVKFVIVFAILSAIFGKVGFFLALLVSPAFLGIAYISATKIAIINLFALVTATFGAFYVSETTKEEDAA